MTAGAEAFSIPSHATAEAALSSIDELRDGGGSPSAAALPRRFLRHCDEQSVMGTVAVLRAIDAWPGRPPSFSGFGVLSASCQPGRIMGARTLAATRTAGSQGVSPHVVPQCSLHSPASAVSVGLAMHGPHIGVGGGPESFDEGILAAWPMLTVMPRVVDGSAGLWIVFTGWDEEPSLDPQGNPISNPVCRALAMAVVPGAVADAASIRLERADSTDRGGPASRGGAAALSAALAGDARRTIPLAHGFSLHVRPRGCRTAEDAA